ncbi:hypothetical protein E1A91_D12G068400v1 [Gossypium mustelinum]|uniref:Leucine-rich repeat-containing N-terminal plant-type domain-containing protein n=1 Tax=Gossypium mustelinum TaxID=34275 RepID=A0A5D2SBL9_GOSMU|nr:hypothetical protein E1A91_D12G068400v1 [Gossypium mustelinum]
MGCSSSKLDDLPAVALCRERCSFLDEAIQQVKALNEIKASLGWRVVYAWIGDDPCGDGDLPPWSGVTCSTQGDYRVVTELNRYQFDQVTEDAMVDRLSSFSLDNNNFEAVKQLCCSIASKFDV